MWGLLFVCSFSCLSPREHDLSPISWAVVSFSCKACSCPFPSLWAGACSSFPGSACSPCLCWQHPVPGKGKALSTLCVITRCCFVLPLTLATGRCSGGTAQPRCVPGSAGSPAGRICPSQELSCASPGLSKGCQNKGRQSRVSSGLGAPHLPKLSAGQLLPAALLSPTFFVIPEQHIEGLDLFLFLLLFFQGSERALDKHNETI